MQVLENLDFAMSSAAAGILLLMIVHFAAIRPVSRKTVSAMVLGLGGLGIVIGSSMVFLHDFPSLSLVHVTIFAFAPLMIAWGMLELFEDDFKIQSWQIAFAVFSIASHYLTAIHPVFGTVCHFTNIMIYCYLFYITVSTHSHDLVEARCKFRFWFMGVAAIDGIIFTSLHSAYGDNLPMTLQLFKNASLLGLVVIFAYWALKVREHVWALPQNAEMKRPENLTPAENALLTRLQESMENNIWRQEGLTIRKLAENLDAPEHRLRKVINQGLGYRNFAHFVNEHRIEAACEVLADPVKADVPVITIAYEVGYGSLGPFNRAFREIVGESPTEYRRRLFSHA